MKTLKLLQIKLDSAGNKTTCILEQDGIKKEYTVMAVIEMLKQNIFIKNATLVGNELKVLPSMKHFDDLTGTTLNDWYVAEYLGNYHWKCECICGTIRSVYCGRLKNGTSRSCGHDTNKFKDLRNKTFGHWQPIKYIGNKMWLCKCELCHKLKEVSKDSLLDGKSKSCGCNTTGFKDLTDEKFGKLTVNKYIGDGLWECKCACNKIRVVHRQSLLSGQTTSCGACNRKEWQIEALASAEKFNSVLLSACTSLNALLTLQEVADIFDISLSNASLLVRKYNAEMYVQYITTNGTSNAEQELIEFVGTLATDIVTNTRHVLNGKELDIYIPDYKLAIEYNGSYWHSAIKKDKLYHIGKTTECRALGIKLLHVFEHEWNDPKKSIIIKGLIQQYLGNTKRIFARNAVVKTVSVDDARNFLDKYHLQQFVPASEYYGLYYNDELVEVMTFGRPRYTDKYDYELLRLCTKQGYTVVGGANKLFKHFLRLHSDVSIISYCDLSKFTGKVYEQLGMKFDGTTQPNYTYVSLKDLSTLSRYQCTKQSLIERGLGTEEQTEEEIMYANNYVKVYDCGNARYIYN